MPSAPATTTLSNEYASYSGVPFKPRSQPYTSSHFPGGKTASNVASIEAIILHFVPILIFGVLLGVIREALETLQRLEHTQILSRC
jgi:hypothetical protein